MGEPVLDVRSGLRGDGSPICRGFDGLAVVDVLDRVDPNDARLTFDGDQSPALKNFFQGIVPRLIADVGGDHDARHVGTRDDGLIGEFSEREQHVIDGRVVERDGNSAIRFLG